MKQTITESQLRRIILKEIESMVEDTETAGEKAAGTAADATSLSTRDRASSLVKDSSGLATLIMSAIKSSGLGGDLVKNGPKVKEALRLIITNYGKLTKQPETP